MWYVAVIYSKRPVLYRGLWCKMAQSKAKIAEIKAGDNAMLDVKTRVYFVPGVCLAAGILTGWLILWRLASNAAGWFAPATALLGLVCWYLTFVYPIQKRAISRIGLKLAAWAAIWLAIGASFSLGAFLPAGVAEWVSPVMGKFGSNVALWGLAIGIALPVFSGLVRRWRGVLLDLAMLCGLAALWVGQQTELQAAFPPPPLALANLGHRFDFIFWAILVFTLLAIVGYFARRFLADNLFYVSWLWRWAALLSLVGLAASVALNNYGWYRFALLVMVLLVVGFYQIYTRRDSTLVKKALKTGGWFLLMLVGTAIAYFTVTEDLEVVLLRNTAERYTLQFWRSISGDERFATKPTGTLSGQVMDEHGQALSGAAVIVATVSGQAFTAYSGGDGYYTIVNVPEGNYLPMAIQAGYDYAPTDKFGGRVATIRPGQTTDKVTFRLAHTIAAFDAVSSKEDYGLKIGAPTSINKENPVPTTAIRRDFTFERGGKLLDGGIIHEPPLAMGNGPFPILLIVYPGEAAAWEGVSVPLAANGYVVVSYFPRRLLDLQGDTDDLNVLMRLTLSGKFSARADTSKMVLVGGSVSTVYTYLMTRELENSQSRQALKGGIKYGGLVDLFRYRYIWEQGNRIVIDPGISALEYMLIAFGRPDTRPELYLRFSPLYNLQTNSLPPILMVHNKIDEIVPVEQTERMDERLQQLNIPRQTLIYPNLKHYLDTSHPDPAQADMLNQTLAFLKKYVG